MTLGARVGDGLLTEHMKTIDVAAAGAMTATFTAMDPARHELAAPLAANAALKHGRSFSR
jgi:hypothetical protein